MAINPIVRYMLLCDDWHLDGANNRRITIIGLIGNIHAVDEPPYPLFYREFCVFLALTEGRGHGGKKRGHRRLAINVNLQCPLLFLPGVIQFRNGYRVH
jgi:hypothetical protein